MSTLRVVTAGAWQFVGNRVNAAGVPTDPAPLLTDPLIVSDRLSTWIGIASRPIARAPGRLSNANATAGWPDTVVIDADAFAVKSGAAPACGGDFPSHVSRPK